MTAFPDIEVFMDDVEGHYDQAEYDRQLEHGADEAS
jgi:hypothetical protein